MKAASFYNCPYFPSQSLVFTFIKKMFNFSIHPNSKYQLASLVLTKKYSVSYKNKNSCSPGDCDKNVYIG